MSAALHLAGPADLARLTGLVAAFHAEEGLPTDDAAREDALRPLLDGIPHGVAYLIGPQRAPIGYAVITFGWSIELGGMDAYVDEIYIRPGVRGRGIATEVLGRLPGALGPAGVKALHLEVDRENAAARRLYARSGFQPRARYMLMTRHL
ncbi:MAG: GNAT family N-acetyltransferase [Rhodobacteraceae bacterium]|nr:GNAT family N-acetyltransferase [Paracoccaceae bacterium]